MIKHATPDLPSPESCPHRFTEMVTAAHADGMCPLCMAARIERLEAALKAVLQVAEGKFQGEDWQAIDIARAALAGTVSVELFNIERSVGDSLRAENDRLRAEIERLQELLRGVGANRYWEGRWRDEVARIERLRNTLQLHAGDVMSLDGEIRLLRENAEDDAAIAKARIERLEAIETAARTFLNEQTDQNAAALGAALAGKDGP